MRSYLLRWACSSDCSGLAYNAAEFEQKVQKGLDASPITEVLIDRSVIGWKEFELEVVRDKSDNVIIVWRAQASLIKIR